MAEDNKMGVGVGDVVEKSLDVSTKLAKWKNYVIYALLAVVAAEGVGLLWQRGTVEATKTQLVEAQAKLDKVNTALALSKANEQSCKLASDRQNKAIADAGERFNELKERFYKLEEDIKNGKFYKEADDIKRQPTPKTCEEALDFITRNLG